MTPDQILDSTKEMSHLINDRERILLAMKIYANYKLDLASEICLETKIDNKEYFDNFPNTDWELDNNGNLFRGNKNGILSLKDDI